MSRQRKRQIILWYHGCAKYSKNTSNSSTLKLLQQSSLLITWPVLTKTNLVLWLKNGSVYKAYGQIKLSWWSGDSLISGSSSVRVTTKSLLRTSGRDWSWSGSWGTLQSGHWQDSLWDVQLGSEVLDTFVSQGVVVVLPRELSLNETLGSQRLQSLDDVQVSGVNLLMLWLVEVLLSNNNTLCDS